MPLLALVTSVVVGPACSDKPPVSFEISVPNDVVADTVWLEIGAYEGASCAAVTPMLRNGVPDGASARVAFRRDAPQPPTVGDLARGSYAFAAVAKGDDCRVLATGCAEVNVDDSRSVTIATATTESPSGGCGAGAVCAAARCVPANDNQNPSVGAQCSLELLGAGPLANPVGGAGTTVSAPAVAATPSGFVVAYREIDPDGTAARVTLLPIDASGGALDATRPLLKGRCPSAEETDGVGLVMNGADGQIVLARSACGAKPGLELLSFNTKPAVTIDPNFRSSDSPTARKLELSGAHVAARGPGASVIVFREDGATRISTIVPGLGVAAPTGTFGGAANMSGAWVAASDKVLAVLSAGPPRSEPIADAGADGGNEAGAPAPPGDPQLALLMVPASTSADQLSFADNKPHAPLTFPGLWGAVAALGSRVIVVSDGGGPGRSVSYRAFDLDRPSTSEASGFSVEGGTGAVSTADITMLDDKAYFAVLKPGGISLHVLAGASTTPRPLREVVFGKQPRIPSVSGVRDTGRIAVAATSTRVAVAWTTAKSLTRDDPTGGYAVFACTP
ncbi:MAG TPA: hypothetical protein VLT33_41735 [Labilithrix sp.]|nr:hypothetical protein [Labilithrix sp.]